MKGLTESERQRIQAVKTYLERYIPAEESRQGLMQIRNDDDYVAEQVRRAKRIKEEVAHAVSLLDVGREKTLVELRYIVGLEWRKVYREMNISKSAGVILHKKAMLKLYRRMVEQGILSDSDTNTNTTI